MSDKYEKTCIEKNSDYSIYYGAGKYIKAEQNYLHYDTGYTISYFLQCSGYIKIEGRHYDIHSGDIVIMNPREIHCCNIDENIYHERVSICVNKSILKNFSISCDELFNFFENREKGEGNIIPSATAKDLRLDDLIYQIFSLSKVKNNKNKILSICKTIELLTGLSSAVSINTVVPTDCVEENHIISKAIAYIGQNFTTLVDCSKISDKLFISKYRLEHLFKECLGISMWEYVIIKRLILVNELMQEKYSAEEASYIAGFHNYSNFYRLYKKHFNMTPTEFKKNIKH